jgi:hypothetical protein
MLAEFNAATLGLGDPMSSHVGITLEILNFGCIRTLRMIQGRSRGFIALYHKHLSPRRRADGNYTSLRSIQASGGTKSTSAQSRIHQDPGCAELCAGSTLATSGFSPSPTEGANPRNRYGVGMGEPRDQTSVIPRTRPWEETQGKNRDSRTSGRKNGRIRLNQRCGGL